MSDPQIVAIIAAIVGHADFGKTVVIDDRFDAHITTARKILAAAKIP